MNRWILRASVLFLAANLALACGDDEDDGNGTGSGGSSGKGGSAGSGGKGGTSSSGGSAGEGEGGTPEPGSGGGGGAPAPAMCEAPTPPDVGGEGGAGGGAAEGGSGGAAPATEELAIAGSYTDDFDGEHVITSAIWTNYGVYNISQFDNDDRYVIARNDESNTANPCAWSRFDWTFDGADLYYCQSAYDAESEDAALASEPADGDDLEEGCSGFSWSKLTPQ
jgi:hypothetical protein